jgi:hypothetical protein
MPPRGREPMESISHSCPLRPQGARWLPGVSTRGLERYAASPLSPGGRAMAAGEIKRTRPVLPLLFLRTRAQPRTAHTHERTVGTWNDRRRWHITYDLKPETYSLLSSLSRRPRRPAREDGSRVAALDKLAGGGARDANRFQSHSLRRGPLWFGPRCHATTGETPCATCVIAQSSPTIGPLQPDLERQRRSGIQPRVAPARPGLPWETSRDAYQPHRGCGRICRPSSNTLSAFSPVSARSRASAPGSRRHPS